MIIDHLDNAAQYFELNPHFEKACAFLRRDDLAQLEPGKYDIDGDNAWALVSECVPKTRADVQLEAHRQYIDVHYTVSGVECVGWRATDTCTIPISEYDAGDDAILFADESLLWVDVPAEHFALLLPGDAHAPVRESNVRKVILKLMIA
jgi:YhcH/YjgK/YiaL family protein